MAKTNQERAKQLEKIKKKALGGLLLKKKKKGCHFYISTNNIMFSV